MIIISLHDQYFVLSELDIDLLFSFFSIFFSNFFCPLSSFSFFGPKLFSQHFINKEVLNKVFKILIG